MTTLPERLRASAQVLRAGPSEWRRCQFCGCNTNALVRGCCKNGQSADRIARELEEAAGALEVQQKGTAGVTVTVPINRPATLEEAEHAARIGACLPNGVMFDAFGRERVRYVRVIHDGTTCVVSPGDVADLVDPERPEDYRTEDVYLSKEEFDALPEFNGF